MGTKKTIERKKDIMKKITLKVASLMVFAALMTACFAGCTDTNKEGDTTTNGSGTAATEATTTAA